LQTPTSTLLAQLIEEAPADRTSVAWFVSKLEQRSFCLLILVMAIIGLTPGIASLSGLLLAIPSLQMISGYDSPALPAFLTKHSIATPDFAKWVTRVVPLLRRVETFAHPRWQMTPVVLKRIVGIVILIMAVTITLPFPFAYTIPTLVIILIAFAYLQEDGLLLMGGFVAAALSLAFSVAQVWAALRAASFAFHLWK
jgi:hypothetical protein